MPNLQILEDGIKRGLSDHKQERYKDIEKVKSIFNKVLVESHVGVNPNNFSKKTYWTIRVLDDKNDKIKV